MIKTMEGKRQREGKTLVITSQGKGLAPWKLGDGAPPGSRAEEFVRQEGRWECLALSRCWKQWLILCEMGGGSEVAGRTMVLRFGAKE